MPGWKKNIPICLQAEEQERGEPGGRAWRPSRAPPVPPGPPASRDLSSGRQGRGAEPLAGVGGRSRSGGTLRIPRGDLGVFGGSRGGRETVLQQATFRLGKDFFFFSWRGPRGTPAAPGPARTWSPGSSMCGGRFGCGGVGENLAVF